MYLRERLLDVIKWGLILAIAGAVFYTVCPKYEFAGDTYIYRINKITGQTETLKSVSGILKDRKWKVYGEPLTLK